MLLPSIFSWCLGKPSFSHHTGLLCSHSWYDSIFESRPCLWIAIIKYLWQLRIFLRLPWLPLLWCMNSSECPLAWRILPPNGYQSSKLAFVYFNDTCILVASMDTAAHKEHLRLLLQQLQEYSQVRNISKGLLGQESIDFLSHYSIIPLSNKVDAITSFQPQCSNRQWPAGFLGMANFCQGFIPAAARIMPPLFEAP